MIINDVNSIMRWQTASESIYLVKNGIIQYPYTMFDSFPGRSYGTSQQSEYFKCGVGGGGGSWNSGAGVLIHQPIELKVGSKIVFEVMAENPSNLTNANNKNIFLIAFNTSDASLSGNPQIANYLDISGKSVSYYSSVLSPISTDITTVTRDVATTATVYPILGYVWFNYGNAHFPDEEAQLYLRYYNVSITL